MGETCYLVADVGGTNTRISLTQGTKLLQNTIKAFNNDAVNSLEIILTQYLDLHLVNNLDGICFAVAGPVEQNSVTLTNASWTIDLEQLKRMSGSPTAGLLNDLQAQAYALPSLKDEHIEHLFGPKLTNRGDRMLVCGIGTGFNIAEFVPTAYGPIVPPAEAGHARIPVRTDQEQRIVNRLVAERGFASIEDILSGSGLTLLNRYICPEIPRTSKEVVEHSQNDPKAQEVLNCMVRFAGSIFGDLALTTLPFGGIYLIGGVSRAIAPFIHESNYGAAFCDKGRFSEFNRQFATFVVVDDFAGLKGCANYLAWE